MPLKVVTVYPKRSQLVSMFDSHVKNRYCKTPEDRAIMVSKEFGKKSYIVTVEKEFFHELLAALREVAEI